MPRSGSTMLCDLLTQTGVAGRPNSFFRELSMADFTKAWDVPARNLNDFDQVYLDAALVSGMGGTACFGLRSMWDNMPALLNRLGVLYPQADDDVARLTTAFGPMQFIHLARHDHVAEAVSLAMAHQTGLWHRHADGTELERSSPPAPPVYDAKLILREYESVVAGTRAWRDWFSANKIIPLDVSYEALSSDPGQQLARILSFLDLDPDRARGITPDTAKLATALSAEWAIRFREEAGLPPVGP